MDRLAELTIFIENLKGTSDPIIRMNKKIYVGILLALFYSSFSAAQIQVRYGLSGGVNFANGDFAEVGSGVSMGVDTQYRTAFYFGGLAEYSIPVMSPKLYGQVGLMYSGNGFRIENSANPEVRFRIHQLNVPILLKYELFPQLRVAAGGYLGTILGVQEKIGDEPWESTGTYKSFDAGFLVGVEVPLTYHLFLEARYNFGLVNIADVEEMGVEADFTNRVFQVGMGYKF